MGKAILFIVFAIPSLSSAGWAGSAQGIKACTPTFLECVWHNREIRIREVLGVFFQSWAVGEFIHRPEGVTVTVSDPGNDWYTVGYSYQISPNGEVSVYGTETPDLDKKSELVRQMIVGIISK